MITRTVEYEGVTIKLRRETRQGSLMRAVYRKVFGRLHPALYTILNNSSNTEALLQAMDGLDEDTIMLFSFVMDFILVMVHVTDATGLPFAWPVPGEVPSEDRVKEIFRHFMLDETGLWSAVITAANEMNAPVTPLEQQPAQVVEAMGELSPNSSAPVEDGKINSSAN